MKHRCILFLALLILIAGIASAAVETTVSLPVYPGGKVGFELNLTEKDFLPALKELLPTIPGLVFSRAGVAPPKTEATPDEPGTSKPPSWANEAVGQMINDTLVKELQAAIADLDRVSIVMYAIPEEVSSDQLADFYMRKLGLSKGWQSTLRANDPNGRGFVRLYTKPDLAAMFGFVQGKGQVLAFATDGRIDMLAVSRIISKFLPMMMFTGPVQTSPEGEPQPAPAPTDQ